MKNRRRAKALLKALARVVPLDDGRFAVDVDGLTILLKRNANGWLIDIDDGVMIGYRRDADDICHVTIEREQQAA
jgi:hypothetical protein